MRSARASRGSCRPPGSPTGMRGGRPKVLLIGDGGVETGYARVIRSIFAPLRNSFDLTQLATRHPGGPCTCCPWPVVVAADTPDPLRPVGAAGGRRPDRAGRRRSRLRPRLPGRLRGADPIGAPPDAAGHSTRRSRRGRSSRSSSAISPVPVTSSIPMSRGGRSRRRWRAPPPTALRCPPSRRCTSYRTASTTTTFHPFAGPEGERRSRARAELGLPDGDDSFIVLNANRNLLKKRLDLTLAGFAEFARGKPPGVRLLLHTEPDAEMGWNLPLLARRLGISGRVLFTGAGRSRQALPDAALNALYQRLRPRTATPPPPRGGGW